MLSPIIIQSSGRYFAVGYQGMTIVGNPQLAECASNVGIMLNLMKVKLRTVIGLLLAGHGQTLPQDRLTCLKAARGRIAKHAKKGNSFP